MTRVSHMVIVPSNIANLLAPSCRCPFAEIQTDEILMGITLLRRWLISNAQGQVLEIAGGTGRNLSYYPSGCELFVTDVSKEMVAVAETKAQKKGVDARFLVMDVSKLDFPDNTFDTVVDTFGLCSFEDEGRALAEMKRVCKPGGKILLLEYGRSYYKWLNDILDDNAGRHASQWGCVWNKDILQLVVDAGLTLQSNRRFHFGTSYFMVASKE